MKYVNTYWEERNLDVSSCEIRVEPRDAFEEFAELDAGLQERYRVAKIPVNKPEFLFGLPELGYVFIETQIQLSMRRGELRPQVPPPGYEDFAGRIEYKRIETLAELERELSCLKEGDMFDTDRIALDPAFGGKVSGRRYYNWVTDIFNKSGGGVYISKIDGNRIHFNTLEMHKTGVVSTALGGAFVEAQDNAYHLIAPNRDVEYVFNVLNAKRFETAVSSNNPSILKLHLQKGFKVKKLNYVYIRHVRG